MPVMDAARPLRHRQAAGLAGSWRRGTCAGWRPAAMCPLPLHPLLHPDGAHALEEAAHLVRPVGHTSVNLERACLQTVIDATEQVFLSIIVQLVIGEAGLGLDVRPAEALHQSPAAGRGGSGVGMRGLRSCTVRGQHPCSRTRAPLTWPRASGGATPTAWQGCAARLQPRCCPVQGTAQLLRRGLARCDKLAQQRGTILL